MSHFSLDHLVVKWRNTFTGSFIPPTIYYTGREHLVLIAFHKTNLKYKLL